MKYVWILCLALVCALQSAYGILRDIPDSVNFGPVVAGATHTMEKNLSFTQLRLTQVRLDGIQDVFLHDSGRDVFKVVSWDIGVLQQDTTLLLTLEFSPKAVAEYHSSVILTLVGNSFDTLRLSISGRGVGLRAEPVMLDFGTLSVEAKEEKTLPLVIVNDGIVPVTLQLRLSAGGVNGPFTFSPANDLIIDSESELRVEVTCSARGQTLTEFLRVIRDSLVISIVENNAVQPVKAIDLSARFVAPSAVRDSVDLDFGNVLTGTSRTMKMSFTNPTNDVLSVPRIEIEGGKDSFYTLDSLPVREIAPGATVVTDIVFAPKQPGPVSAHFSLIARLDDREIAIREAELTGRGFTFDVPRVSAGAVRVKVDEQFQLPVTVSFYETDRDMLRNSNVETLHYSFPLQLNASIARVSGGNIDSVGFDNGNQIVYVSGAVATKDIDTVLQLGIGMHALLGDTDSSGVSGVSGESVRWTVPGTNFVRAGTVQPGSIVLTDIFIWPNGQKRLINTRRGGLVLDLTPNPVSAVGIVAVHAAGFSGTATIAVYSSLGAEVYSSTLGEPGTAQLNIGDLNIGAGIYYCRLSSGRNSLVKLLRVE